MTTKKYKHLSFDDRCIIQQFITFGRSFTEVSNRLHKDRTTISKEIKTHRYTLDKGSKRPTCLRLKKPPYVCNACEARPHCTYQRFMYDAAIAHTEYKKTLSLERASIKLSKEQVDTINEVVAPLMIQRHHSVNQVFIEHPECLPISKTTFYRYIDLGLVHVKNIDLQRKVKYKVKKEDSPSKQRIINEQKLGHLYTNFKEYMDEHPTASVVEMDTVIGTSGGKGGKCFLTLLFRQYNFMLIYLMPYKRSEYVTKVFLKLRDALGDDEYKRLFEVILTDNGTEFADSKSIMFSLETGELLSNLFYCEPYSAWQKGSIEKNHQYIRYVLPKGTSFSGLTQEDCNLLASHINSTPRKSLNNRTPYEAAKSFLRDKTLEIFRIISIPTDEVNLSVRSFRK